ncbi:MAG: MMPL family transporter [Bdellovibrionales bacterium]|nr:MMPL family transporter [Bdellovibrionales bacterium]
MKWWIQKVIEYKRSIVFLTLAISVGLVLQLKNLSIIIDPDDALPQSHPYLVVNNEVEKIFGNKFTVVIGITATDGTIFQTPVLEKVKRITEKISSLNGVVRSNINSLAARKAKNIKGDADGMTVEPLMEVVPQTPEQFEKLKKALESNPVYSNLLISKDQKTTQIVAEFKKIPGGFRAIDTAVHQVVESEKDTNVEITVGGLPSFLSLLEVYSERMGFLFPLAVLIIGLIHYEAFRTFQALFLPLVTAMIAVIWAVGILALIGQPMDVFNASTPILILAIAAGHAVQILKRYYEEYHALRNENISAQEKNRRAVFNSLVKVGPVMIVACIVAALGFFSLIIFEIKSIRTFGIFTGSGVLSALILELTFIPALRSMLPPPGEREQRREAEETFWDRLTLRFYHLVTERRKAIYIFSSSLILLLSMGGYWLKIDNSQKSYFYGNIPARMDDDKLNERMGGTNTMYLLVDTGKEDGIKDPAVLKGMESMQEFFAKEALIGKTVSLVDFIKRMNQSMNEDKPDFYSVPGNSDLIAQYLLLYSNSGEPGDFDSYVDYVYQKGLVQVFLKTDRSSYIDDLSDRAKAHAATVFPATAKVSIGGGATGGVALNEVMIEEKILNILQIMAAVFLVSSLVFRSFLAGALILVPLIAAVLVNFGVMGLVGIPLQIATALVSAMAVGIGADYGIYMSYRIREELRSQKEERQAIKNAFHSAGKATLFVSSAVAGGFGVLMLSWGFMIHMWMGFLIGMAMLVSSITALTVFPSLILTLRPKFIFEKQKGTK